MCKLKAILILVLCFVVSCQSSDKNNSLNDQANQKSGLQNRKLASDDSNNLESRLEDWKADSQEIKGEDVASDPATKEITTLQNEIASESLKLDEDKNAKDSLANNLNANVKDDSVDLWFKWLDLNSEETKNEFTKSFHHYLKRKLNFLLVVQNLVTKLDEKIIKNTKSKSPNQNDFNLTQMDEYVLLLGLRAKFEQTMNEFKYDYAKLMSIAFDKKDPQNEKAVFVRDALEKFLEISFKEDINKLSIYTITSELEEVNEVLRSNLISSFTFGQYLSLNPKQIENLKKISLNKQQQEKQDKLIRRTTKLVAHWKTLLNDSEDLRTPQSGSYNFYPSTDTHGTMTGRSFNPGEWAITLDDGPSKYTSQYLDNLQGNEKYTFFWLSQLIPKYPSVIERAGKMNSLRASHSMTHANLSASSEAKLKIEVDNAVDIFRNNIKADGKDLIMFRCPYGACGNGGRQHIARQNLIHIFWNVDSLDWQDKNPVSVTKRVKSQMSVQKRGVILFHDIHPQGVVASNEILKMIRADSKLKLVTIGEKINEGALMCDELRDGKTKAECKKSL